LITQVFRRHKIAGNGQYVTRLKAAGDGSDFVEKLNCDMLSAQV